MSVQPTLLQTGLPNKCWLCPLKEIKPSKRHKLIWLEVPIKVDIHFMNHLLASKLVWQSISWTSKFLVSYGVLMLMAFILTYQWSLNDHRLIRDVGVWVTIVSVTFFATLPQCLVTGAVHQISVEATLLCRVTVCFFCSSECDRASVFF